LSGDGPGTATILVANDHEWTARSIETILGAEGYRVVRAFTATQALERAAEVRPDACVLDVQLPDRDGMTLCRELREDPTLGAALPVFLTTAGPSGRAERLAGYRAGAWEFFGQPLDGETLLLKLRVYLEAKAVVDGLRRESLVDHTTGLYSRRGLVRRGGELIAEAARRHRAVACLVLRPDLPELEAAVASAEPVARRVGELLRASGRAADAIGRVGPLDFGLVAVGAGESEVRQIVRRFNELAAQLADNGSGRLTFRAAYCSIADAAVEDVDVDGLLIKATGAVSAGGPLVAAAGR
jgi:DNA-binding response OmpR family regulator